MKKISFFKTSNMLLLSIIVLLIIFTGNVAELKQLNSIQARSLTENSSLPSNQTEWTENYDAALAYDVFGRLVWTDWHDAWVSESVRRWGLWEYTMAFLWTHVFREGQKVLCLGGHIGVHVMQISELVGRSGHVYSFEANPSTFQLLRANIKLNHFKNVDIFNKAVYHQHSIMKFEQVSENTGASFLNPGQQVHWKGLTEVTVEAVRIDDFLKNVSSIDVIQMDIEGMEYWAMQGAEKLISQSPELTIITEWHPDSIKRTTTPETVYNFYTQKGFVYFEIMSNGLRRLNKTEALDKLQRDVLLTHHPEKWENLKFA